jgi:tripartite-type tricarboxylate transporter receptor subunit TctC
MNKHRLLTASLLAVASFAAAVPAALAQSNWPSRPVRLIVPYPAGGPVDQLARTIAPKLGEQLGQPIVIDNRAGASGTIGIDATVRAEPDGYTFGFGVPGGITVLPHLQKLPYSVEGINYVSLVARVPQVIAVNSKSNINTLPELIALAKKEPGKLAYGSAGNATTPHLGAELFAQEAGVKMMHVPYKGAAPAITALLGGEVQLMAADLSALLPFQSKGIKILAVSGPRRLDVLPGVPTTTELGLPAVYSESNYGIIEPSNVPPAIGKKMRDALVAVLAMPAVKAQIAAQGALAMSTTPDEYKKLMQDESAKWATVLKKGNITLD